MMNVNANGTSDALLDEMTDEMIIEPVASDLAGDFANAPRAPRRDLPQMMRKIPVTLTLEVGSARISLQDLMNIGPDSVVELDALAGEPLVIKVNGTAIGRAEVVVAGENYGLKVIDLDGLNLDMMTS
ncbi:flagellar motor switch protein FliN [Massilia dura]|uniref:Flagellar motor switch protein FliN n=2 Tax=Pseudoduganella dura TaxID=321982 RepID=A0A6I3XPI4_9BURK|nr:flagellar motor switch protein FliN [Pseudoduganella dura]